MSFHGIYKGICTTTADPAALLRVKVIVPQIFGNATTETEWALPCHPVGSTAVPSPGQGVWVMFEGGDINYPVYMGTWL